MQLIISNFVLSCTVSGILELSGGKLQVFSTPPSFNAFAQYELTVIDEDVQPQNFGVHTAWRKAKDRDTWHQVVSMAMLC